MPNTSDHDVVGKLRRMGFSLNDLPEHGVRQRRNVDQRSKYNQSLGRSIEQRPMMINQRNRIGDFD